MNPTRDLMQNLIEKRYNGKILQFVLNHIDVPVVDDTYVFKLFKRTLNLSEAPDGTANYVEYIKSLKFDLDSKPTTSLAEIMDCVDEERDIAEKIFDFILRMECDFCQILLYGNYYKAPKNWYELINFGW